MQCPIKVDESVYRFMNDAQPERWVLRTAMGRGRQTLYAERKGVWTWIKAHILHRAQYRLQRIVHDVGDRELAVNLPAISVVEHLRHRITRYNQHHSPLALPEGFARLCQRLMAQFRDESLVSFADVVSLSIPFLGSDGMRLYLQTAPEIALAKLCTRVATYLQLVPNVSPIVVENGNLVAAYARVRFKNLWKDCFQTVISKRWPDDLDSIPSTSEFFELALTLKVGSREAKELIRRGIDEMSHTVECNIKSFDTPLGASHRAHPAAPEDMDGVIDHLEKNRVLLTSRWVEGFFGGDFRPSTVLQAAPPHQKRVIQLLRGVLDDMQHNLEVVKTFLSHH